MDRTERFSHDDSRRIEVNNSGVANNNALTQPHSAPKNPRNLAGYKLEYSWPWSKIPTDSVWQIRCEASHVTEIFFSFHC